MKAIIFGINGQDGHYLKEICNKKGIEAIGISRSGGNWIQGDIADYNFVEQLVTSQQPDFIFHLAANSTTRHDALFDNHAAIATGSINVLEAVKRKHPSCKVFITGSGVQFVNTGKPIKETDTFEPNSPYSVARIYSVYAARYYRSLGIKTYVGYLFHHESPLRKHHHVSKMTTDIVKRIAAGSNEKLVMGDISVTKEWAFAGDIAEGIFTLTNQDTVFEATIGTGKAYSIQQWLEACFAAVNLNWKEHVQVKQNFNPEYKTLVSDPTTLKGLGWYDRTGFDQLVQLMLINGDN